jgi:hypothetical protein
MELFMRIFSILASAALAGCASSAAVPLSADTVQITASAAPICGGTGAANVASKAAASETLRHGFDKYIIMGSQAQNNVSTAYVWNQYGGGPVLSGSHDHGLIVKMFKDGDPNGANALSARDVLGSKWQEIIQNPTLTC